MNDDALERHAWITAVGVVTNCNENQGSFDLNVEQPLSATKDLKPADRPKFPIRANIDLTSSRFKSCKISPVKNKNGRFIQVTGFLVRTVESGQSLRFVLDVENFTWLGQAPPPVIPIQSYNGRFILNFSYMFTEAYNCSSYQASNVISVR